MITQVDPTSLRRAQAAVRGGEFDRARALLADWDETISTDSSCLNLLGVLAVSQSDWKQATRFWRAAIRADRTYEPARQNLRRHFELFEFGQSHVALVLGDEPEFQILKVAVRGDH